MLTHLTEKVKGTKLIQLQLLILFLYNIVDGYIREVCMHHVECAGTLSMLMTLHNMI